MTTRTILETSVILKELNELKDLTGFLITVDEGDIAEWEVYGSNLQPLCFELVEQETIDYDLEDSYKTDCITVLYKPTGIYFQMTIQRYENGDYRRITPWGIARKRAKLIEYYERIKE